MDNFVIRNIQYDDLSKLKKFNCGKDRMDNFFYNQAMYNHICGKGITKVAVYEEQNEEEIIGYYTLKCDRFKIEDPKMSSDPNIIPCIEISRLAVDIYWQKGKRGINIGTYLMGYIIDSIKKKIATKVGCRFITLHAYPWLASWYEEEFGFEKKDNYEDELIYMYLDIIDKNELDRYCEIKKELSVN